ncbi:MAG: LysR substrate-binding domain-containing protein [Parvibaculum sp.]|nr:LysR substrate-binding domain-containing protein [Parvibaculum sp.]
MNIRNLDLNLLRVFDAIYAARNISRAADHLGLSQPATSHALKRLREHLGDPLFVRAGKGLEATTRAEQLIGPVREALDAIRLAVEGVSFDPATLRRKFRIVMHDPLEPVLMPPLIERLTREAPGASLELLPIYGLDPLDEINNRRIDLFFPFYAAEHPQICSAQFGKIDFVCIARRGHPEIGASMDRATFDRLGHVVLITSLRARSAIEEYLGAQGCRRRAVVEVSKLWSVLTLVAASDLISIVPRMMAGPMQDKLGIDIFPMPYDMPGVSLSMSWHIADESDPGHSWLRRTIGDILATSIPTEAATGAA